MNLLRCTALMMIVAVITPSILGPKSMHARENDSLLDRYHALLKSHRESMAKLKTGEAEITGTLKDVSEEVGVLQGGISIFLVFDNDQGLLRFDRTEPKRYWRPDAAARKNLKDWKAVPAGGRFVRTATAIIYNRLGDDFANIKKVDEELPDWVRPIDLRVLGLAHAGDIDRGTLSGLIEGYYDSQIPMSIVEEGPLVKVTWIIGKTTRRTVWFDTEKDCWPVRLTLVEMRGVDAQRNPIWNNVVRQEIKTELVRKKGVFVPSDVVISNESGQREELLHFEWKSLNGKVDYQLFTPEGMSQNDIRWVIDDTMGERKSRELPSFIPPPGKK